MLKLIRVHFLYSTFVAQIEPVNQKPFLKDFFLLFFSSFFECFLFWFHRCLSILLQRLHQLYFDYAQELIDGKKKF